jgi:hypothetical protein
MFYGPLFRFCSDVVLSLEIKVVAVCGPAAWFRAKNLHFTQIVFPIFLAQDGCYLDLPNDSLIERR